MVKIGADSCPMVEKRNHKIQGIFRNAHSYLKGRIIGIGKYLHTLVLGWRRWKLLATPPGRGYKRRTETVECQSGSNHSHSMVSVMFLLLNLLFCFCMHSFRLRCLTVLLMDMLCWFIALNLIWLYICWHKYVRLPLCDNSKN